MPVAVSLSYARSSGRRDRVAPVRLGLVAALPLTFLAGSLFQSSARQSQWEAVLAASALIAAWQAARLTGAILAAAAALVVVRQTMEIDVVLRAALTLGSRDAIVSSVGAAATAAFAAFAWGRAGDRRVAAPAVSAHRPRCELQRDEPRAPGTPVRTRRHVARMRSRLVRRRPRHLPAVGPRRVHDLPRRHLRSQLREDRYVEARR